RPADYPAGPAVRAGRPPQAQAAAGPAYRAATTYPPAGNASNGTTYGARGGGSAGIATGPGGSRAGANADKGKNAGGKPRKGTGAPAKGRPRKDPLWARLTVIFGAVLMLASGGVIVGSKLLIGRYTENISQQNLIGTAGRKDVPAGKALDGPINLLLLGVDERSRNPGDVRSDTIIILHIPASHDQAYLVSVPRDTYVDVPAFAKSGYPGGRSKITDAFHAGAQKGAGRAGGAQLVAQIINRLTGVEFDGAAIIDFGGFRRVIDALGGVTMCVDHEVKSQHMRVVDGEVMWLSQARERGGGKPVVHKEGCRRMEGWEALDYSRQRYGLPRGDYDRQRHQQQLIKAMAKEATRKGMITDLGKLDRVIKAAGGAFILDTGGVRIEDFVFTLKGVAANQLVLVKTNGGDFHSAGVQGQSAESLSPESLDMFAAVRDGTLAEWLLVHPNYVSKEK
ncbi:MAG TPA: LCP family protein, partial [Pilimelia sp.]|nr:LCP family protein [Pilimelia sp.]